MSYNLTNEFIDESFQQLAQISGSSLVNGTGSLITDLDITVSQAANADTATLATNATNAVNAQTASFLEGSVASASFADLALTASYVAGTNVKGEVSNAAFAAEALEAITAGFATTATSASYATLAGNATSASHALQADNATTADLATLSLGSNNTIVRGKNISGVLIQKGTPLYFTGSGTSGNLVGVFPADASNPARMPAAGIAGATMNTGEEADIFLDGFINGVDTSAFNSGDTIYVNVGGGYTNQRPTGASNLVQSVGYVEKVDNINGSGVIQGSGRANDIPNLSQGHFFVGGEGDVGITVASSSFVKSAENNIFAGTQTFDNINVNGTGSFAYIQSVTGSAKVIGDAFLILNNQTPAERYAGIRVIDSGSSPATTASLEFDGLTNDWFYEYQKDGDTDDFAVFISGPEYNTKGSPTYPTANKIQKATGGHHIGDSNISDDGSKVAIDANTVVTGSVEASGGFIGNLTGIADTATTANSLAPGNFTISGSLTVSSSAAEGFSFFSFPELTTNSANYIFEGGESFDFRGEGYIPRLQLRRANGTFDSQAVAWRLSAEDPDFNYFNRFTVGAWGTLNGFRPSGSDHVSLFQLGVTAGNNYSDTVMRIEADAIEIGTDGFTNTIDFGTTSTVTNTRGGINNGKIQVDTPSNNNTGSIDMTQGNIFQVFIGNQSNRLELQNITEGQAINIIIEQEGSIGGGTVEFGPEFAFPGGTAPTISVGAGNIDMISGVAIDTGTLFCAFSQNLA